MKLQYYRVRLDEDGLKHFVLETRGNRFAENGHRPKCYSVTRVHHANTLVDDNPTCLWCAKMEFS